MKRCRIVVQDSCLNMGVGLQHKGDVSPGDEMSRLIFPYTS